MRIAALIILCALGCQPAPPATNNEKPASTPAKSAENSPAEVADKPDANSSPVVAPDASSAPRKAAASVPAAPTPAAAPALQAVAEPAKAIRGSWKGVRFEESKGAAGDKLAATMLVQFTDKEMVVTLGAAGKVQGPWKPGKSGENTLVVIRSSPPPAQEFPVRFYGPDEITMKVSSSRQVRFARIGKAAEKKAPDAPTSAPAPSPP